MALVSSLIPVVAILPILLYIGMLIGSQAFQESPREPCAGHYPGDDSADRRLGQNHDRRRTRAAGTNAAAVGFDKLGNTGILYKGLATLGGGATLAGIILGAVTVFIIERQLEKAAAFALAGSVLTFFGLIHAEDLGIGQSPVVALSYFGIAVMLQSSASSFAAMLVDPTRSQNMTVIGRRSAVAGDVSFRASASWRRFPWSRERRSP